MTVITEELERLPTAMATAVAPHLATANLEGYKRFLEAMVHYTRASGDRLRHAAQHAPSGELRAFFDRLAVEESGHYRLAEADLQAFGASVSSTTPEGVAAFHRAWMESVHPAFFLGALYVLENVGTHLAGAAMTNLGRLGLGRDRVRFVMVHLDADVEHGADTARHAFAFAERDGEMLIASASRAAAFWVELHRSAFAEAR